MSSVTIPCAQGVSGKTLAAWRDGTLGEREAARLRAHVADCPACQAQLDVQERADAAIRAQPVPIPDERLWRGVRDGIEHPRRRMAGGANRSGRPMTRRALISGIAAVAAIALITVGFARVFQLRQAAIHLSGAHATATPNVNVTPVPPQTQAIAGRQLTWQGATLPPGVPSDSSQTVLSMAIAATDGNTAYACFAQANPDQPLQIWVTHDRATTWALVGQIPAVGAVSDCALQVDQGDAQRLVANVSGQNMTTLASISDVYLSEDGGATWRLIPNTTLLGELITVEDASFAVQYTSALVTGVGHLVISQNGRQRWRPIDGALQPHGVVVSFWASPDGASLLVAMRNPRGNSPVTLWQTIDAGKHWSQVLAPAAGPTNQFTVQARNAGKPWHICEYGARQPSASTSSFVLFCTLDGGMSWQARPGLHLTALCSTCSGGSENSDLFSLTLTNDGALLGGNSYGPTKNGVIQQMTGAGLYRLDPGASHWQSLGPTPGSAIFYAGAPGTEVMWGVVGGVYGDMTLSADVGGHQTLPRQIGTAMYS